MVHGGRVGFGHFGQENWEWRERGKEDGAAGWSEVGAVRALFRQVGALRPTSMALPPNLWSGLQDSSRLELERLGRLGRLGRADAEAAALRAVAIDADSPGELSRIEVVDPPYIAP